jgi:Arc/MetJ-type ribon-helix-helix transcriptional regulator
MPTITVPLSKELAKTVAGFVKTGFAASKADAVRKAIVSLSRERALLDLLEAELEIRDGKALKGDLRVLAKRLSR